MDAECVHASVHPFIHPHTCIHIHRYTNNYTYIHTCMHAYTHICIHTHTYTRTYIHMHTYIHTHTYTHTYTHTSHAACMPSCTRHNIHVLMCLDQKYILKNKLITLESCTCCMQEMYTKQYRIHDINWNNLQPIRSPETDHPSHHVLMKCSFLSP